MKTISSYLVGFVLSLLLTLAAYLFVVHHLLSGGVVVFAIILLAVIQLYVQLVFFLHLGREKSWYWRFSVFLFTAILIGTVVGGSIWIMSHLNYNMTPDEINQYLSNQSGF